MRYPGLAVLAMAAACLSGAAKAEQDCRLQLAATLPIENKHPWRVIVPAQVEGKSVRMIIDTGSSHSALSQEAADRLGIKTSIIAGMRPYLPYAGGEAKYYAKTKGFTLGSMTAPKALFFIMPVKMEEADGLIGADFLRHFDLEFNFADHTLNVFAPHRCPGQVVYWTDAANVAVLPFHMATTDRNDVVSMLDPHIRFTMSLDGRDVPAILDTGASHTAINLMQARVWYHLDEKSPGMEAVGDNGAHRYRFKTLAFGGVSVANPEVLIHPLDQSRELSDEGLLGMATLRKLRVYIAYEERTLYITAADAR
jgi:predicted aspartyl protease